LLKTEDFFDFETKYMQGGKGGKKGGKKGGSQGYSIIPADLPEVTYNKAINLGLAVYKAVGCTGIARVDMLIDNKTQEVYFNEVNPMPGGLYAHNWQKKGYSRVQLVTELVRYAEERHKQKSAK
jgi:D-alanine-D-alanine ligase